MVKVNFLPTTFDDSKQAIIDAFKADDRSFFKEYFQNYSDGSMLSNVVDLFAYMSTYFNYMTSVSANEPFITSAQLEKNIFGAAKSLGFVPHRVVASRCKCRFTLPDNFTTKYQPDLTETISLPVYTQIRSRQNKVFTLMEGISFKYDTITETWRAFTIEDGELILDKAVGEDVTDTAYWKYETLYFLIKQGTYEARVYRPTGLANQQITLERVDIDDEHESIIISSMKPPYDKWEELTNILDFSLMNNNLNNTYDNLTDFAESNIWINNTNSNGIDITFGDGTFGKIPEEDDVMTIKYFITDGNDSNGSNGFSMASSIDYKKNDATTGNFSGSNFSILLDETNYANGSSGGAAKQSAESVRTIAPYTFASQDRIVNEKDYSAHLMSQNYVALENVKIISGENYSLPFLGGVVAITSKEVLADNDNIENMFLTDNEKETLRYYTRSKCVTGNDSIAFANPEILFVLLSGNVYYRPLLYPKGDVESIFDNTVSAYFNTVNTFDSYYKHSNLIGSINNQNEIDHISLSYHFYYVKKITADNIEDDVTLNLGNAIEAGSLTSTFTQNLLIPNDEERYFKVIIDPIAAGVASTLYMKYYYSLADGDDGNLVITEVVKDVNDVVQTTTEGNIGTIDYNTGKIVFNFGSYESLLYYEKFKIMDAAKNGTSCFKTFADVLRDNNDTTPTVDAVPFYIKFAFNTSVEDSFKSSGSILSLL